MSINSVYTKTSKGFALVPVVFMLALLGLLAFMLSRESASNLAMTQAQQDKKANEALLDAAIAHGRWLAMNNDCSVPDDENNLAIGESSYNLQFSGDPQSMAITASTVNAAGESLEQTSDAFKLYDFANPRIADLDASDDAHLKLESGKEFDNHGSGGDFHVNPRSSKIEIGVLKFDMTTLPSDIQPQGAELRLMLKDTHDTGLFFKVHRITADWEESTVSAAAPWAMLGGDYEANEETSFVAGDTGLKVADLTSLASEWLQGVHPNYGVLLRVDSTAADNHYKFYSKEEADAALHPKLRVNYVCACGIPCELGVVLQDIYLATETVAELAGQSSEPEDVLHFARSTNSASLALDGSSLGFSEHIRGAHQLINGRWLLAFKADQTLDGQTFSKYDVAEYDPVTDSARVIFDGDSVGLGKAIGSIALQADNTLVLSASGSVNVFGNTFQGDDLFWVDPEASTSGLVMDGSTLGIGATLTGSHIRQDGVIIFSLDNIDTVGGVDYNKGDLLEYDPGSGTVKQYFNGKEFSEEEIIRALHIGKPIGTVSTMEAYFTFETDIDPNAQDVIGARSGDLLNGPQWVIGGLNGAMRFDGNDDYLKVDNDAGLQLDTSFTYALWVYNESDLSGDQWLVNKVDGGDPHELRLRLENGAVHWRLANGAQEVVVGPLNGVNANQWHHIAITYDEAANEVRTYLDGLKVNTSAASFAIGANANELRFGENWEGVLDDIRFYKQALRATEIALLLEDTPLGPDSSPPPPMAQSEGGTGSCNGSYADFYNLISYTSSNGTLDWNDSWLEGSDDNDPANGDVRIDGSNTNKVLYLGNNLTSLTRRVPTGGWSNVEVSFDVVENELGKTLLINDRMYVEVNNQDINRALDWRIEGEVKNGDPLTTSSASRVTVDLSAYASNDMHIRLRTSSGVGNSDFIKIDNIKVSCTP